MKFKLHLTFSALLTGAISASATQVDLSTGLSLSGTSGTGAQYTTVGVSSTGTGVIDPFLRLQHNTLEQGFNTSNGGANSPLDTKGGIWTHDILLSAIPVVNRPALGSTPAGPYYEILLDINENSGGANEFLSLSKLQAYTRASAFTGAQISSVNNEAQALSLLGAGATDSFDALGGDTVKLNYALNSGSGSGDLLIYIPVSELGAAAANNNFYLYAEFGGGPQGQVFGSDAGFEEFAVRQGTTPPPVNTPDGGSTIALSGMALLAIGSLRAKLRK